MFKKVIKLEPRLPEPDLKRFQSLARLINRGVNISHEINGYLEQSDVDKINAVAEFFQSVQQQHGLVQTELARLLRISPSDVSGIKNCRVFNRMRFSAIYQALVKINLLKTAENSQK